MYRGTNEEIGFCGNHRAAVREWCIVLAIALLGCDHAVTTNKVVSIDTPFQRVFVHTAGRDTSFTNGTSMNIVVVGGDRTTGEVDLTLHHSDDAPFEQGIVEEAYDFDTFVEDGTLIVRLSLNDDVFCFGGDLTVAVPSRIDVEVVRTDAVFAKDNTVLIEGILGDVTVLTDLGDVSLADIDGDVRVDVRNFNEMSFEGIRGSIAATAESGHILLFDVIGDANIRVTGYGDIKGEILQGGIGSFFTAGGDLRLSQVDYFERLDLNTQEGNVRLTLSGAAYDIEAHAPNGTIEVSPPSLTEETAESAVFVRTMSGDIRIEGM